MVWLGQVEDTGNAAASHRGSDPVPADYCFGGQ